MQYELILNQAEGNQQRRVFSLHLMLAFLLCGIGAGFRILPYFTSMTAEFVAAFMPFKSFGVLALSVGVIIGAITIFFSKMLRQRLVSLSMRVLELAFVGGSSVWFFQLGHRTPAIIFCTLTLLLVVLFILEAFGNARNKAIISEKGISIPKGNFMKTIPWFDVESALLRHGILTVEMPGNRLVQREFKKTSSPTDEIEAFCISEISKAEKRRIARNAW